MDWFFPLIGLIQSLGQQSNLSSMRDKLMAAMQMSPQEESGLRTQAGANVKSGLASRGLLDSGIYGSALAGIEPEIARIKGQRAAGTLGAGGLSGLYASEASQPSFLGSLMPLLMKYGLKDFSGGYSIQPDKTIGGGGSKE
jgi:hypothetical protein